MAIEKVKYEVVKKEKIFEIRDYDPYIIAETVVEDDLESAGNVGFNRLFLYISGENRSKSKIAMTAPVSQKAKGEKIEMTAPVEQQKVQKGYAISFLMPSQYTMETLPKPLDPKVILREVPARRMAAVRYSGRWTEKSYIRYKTELESWINEKGYEIIGLPIWARYNPPFMPWFLRRNEVLIPVNPSE